MEKFVYIVVGSTGEYEDRTEWNVKAFTSDTTAEALAERLNRWCGEHHVATGDEKPDLNIEEKPGEDPDFRVSYTGTEYGIEAVRLCSD